MSKYIKVKDLSKIAVGLNIEGYRPTLTLPVDCKWYNIIQVIDTPLEGNTFNNVMDKVISNNYKLIEQAVNIDINIFVDQLVNLINKISQIHKKILVHVHQYTGTTILDKILFEKTGQETILDTTNFFETPINYVNDYGNIDALISISQCAGIGVKEGTWIIPDAFLDFDVKNNIIFTKNYIAKNEIDEFVDFEYIRGNILVVNNLWNPTTIDLESSYIRIE